MSDVIIQCPHCGKPVKLYKKNGLQADKVQTATPPEKPERDLIDDLLGDGDDAS